MTTKQEKAWLCGYAWHGLVLSSNQTYMPCCRFEDSWALGEISDPMLAEPFVNLREQMTLGKIPDGCKRCAQEEKNGMESKRQRSLRMYPHLADVSVHTLEIHLGNFCNLRCIMCSPEKSSAWNKDAKIAGYQEVFVDKIDLGFAKPFLSQARQIRLLGGETFLSPQLEEVLRIVTTQGNAAETDLLIHTNLTFFPPETIRKALAKFRLVEISCSIDAVGKRNEYIRFPSKWSIVEENFRRFLDWSHSQKNISVNLVSTVSAYSFGGLPELLEWWVDNTKTEKEGYTEKEIWLIPLTSPAFQAVHALPRAIREKVAREILSNRKIAFKKSMELCQFALAVDRPDLTSGLLEWTGKLDRARGVSSMEFVPEIHGRVD